MVLEEKFSDTEEEDELLCPIGMCLMDDAVKTPGVFLTASLYISAIVRAAMRAYSSVVHLLCIQNHCFQRAHILDWISKSGTCPLTRNPLRAEV